VPVTVENQPDVKIHQPPTDDPLRVEIVNPPDEPPPGSGWNSSDREMLSTISDLLVHVGGILAFTAGFSIPMLLPRLF
jgi:hypothetical protein